MTCRNFELRGMFGVLSRFSDFCRKHATFQKNPSQTHENMELCIVCKDAASNRNGFSCIENGTVSKSLHITYPNVKWSWFRSKSCPTKHAFSQAESKIVVLLLSSLLCWSSVSTKKSTFQGISASYKGMYTEEGLGANVLQPDPARVSALSFIPTFFEGSTK